MKRICLRHLKHGWRRNPFMTNQEPWGQQFHPLPPGVHPEDIVEVSFSRDIPFSPVNEAYQGDIADSWRWPCYDGALNITYYRVLQKATNREI